MSPAPIAAQRGQPDARRSASPTAEDRETAIIELTKRIDKATGPRKHLLQQELRRVQEAA